MPNTNPLSGTWEGTYLQRERPFPISAEIVVEGDHLTGTMRDGAPTRTSSVSEIAAETALPPGADEQIVARLREMFPDSAGQPIQFVTQLHPESTLEGWVRGSTVYFLKAYQGDQFSGYRVGDKLVGHQTDKRHTGSEPRQDAGEQPRRGARAEGEAALTRKFA